jgi:hypothetical protein
MLILHRSRDYTCSVCGAMNIELLPDVDAGVELSKSKEKPVKLSFGYKGQITPSEEVTSGIATTPSYFQADSKQIPSANHRRNRILLNHSPCLNGRRRGLIGFSLFVLSSLPP